MSRRLRRRWPNTEIVLVTWCAAESLATVQDLATLGVDQIAFLLDSVVKPSQPSQPSSLEVDREKALRQPSKAETATA
ncbi:hypothetical protein M2244_003013 [Rhodoferax antarcticus]|uniref:Uncharacterized protein n=1 Tax=Rhodoferax antarcticus ANT.BR TaxID=1111071 RepID=A0A1Q8YI80_9BURK|nr:hypothetical protein [Rhodoferax antarcticus]OLP07771.1 hypothetical protein BLL52_0867 [Rhodoferax antarcticus ANT.BR]